MHGGYETRGPTEGKRDQAKDWERRGVRKLWNARQTFPISFGTHMEACMRTWAKRSRIGLLGAALLLGGGSTGFAAPETPGERTIVFFGDSLTAGFGLADPGTQAYPALIQKRIEAERLPWHVVNAGLSGETSAGGLRRIDWVLRQRVDVLVLELGANDGLRGTAPDVTRANLQAIIDRVRSRYPEARIVLAGMRMPTSMGPDYAEAFRAVYPALAAKNKLILIPFLLEGVGGRPELNQGDGIHPTVPGAEIVAATVWKSISQMLKK
jgi:acyl-CoA thioesterase I